MSVPIVDDLDWPTPESLDDPTAGLPAFPLEALPAAIRRFVEAVSLETQTDPAMAGMFAMATLAACAQRRYFTQIQPGWREPLGLYVCVVAEPGERKSAVARRNAEPIDQWEREAGRAIAADLEEHAAKLAVVEQEVKAAKKSGDPDAIREALIRKTDLENAKPVPPRLVADDATPESLARLAHEHDGSIAVLTAEGAGPFAIAAGRYATAGPSFDVLLRGHAGDALRVDRVNRPPLFVPHPAFTFGAMAQPDALHRLTQIPGARGQGLLARFLYAIPTSRVGARVVRSRPVPESIAGEWRALVRRILLAPKATGGDRHKLAFTGTARDRLLDFAEEIEPRLGPSGDLRPICDWANKLAGGVARIAALFAVVDAADAAQAGQGGVATNVHREHVELALGLVPYLVAHARVALAGADADLEARHVLTAIERIRQPQVSKRDLYERVKGRAWCQCADDLDRPIARLAEAGWLLPVAQPKTRGRPSPKWDVHPKAWR